MSNDPTEVARATLLATYRGSVNQFAAASLAIGAAALPELDVLRAWPWALYPALSFTLGVSTYALLRAVAWAQLSRVALLVKVSPYINTVSDLHCFFDKWVENKAKKSPWPQRKLVSSEEGSFLVPVGGSLIVGCLIDVTIVPVDTPRAASVALLGVFIGVVLLVLGFDRVWKKNKEDKPCSSQSQLPN